MNIRELVSPPRGPTLLWIAVIAVALALMIRSDLAPLRWVADLSAQGSPAPARDAHSATGYVLGQRHLLGKYERGETYRWIAATQDLIAAGPFGARAYDGDTIPAGRPQLLPKLYSAWVAAVAWSIHGLTGSPLPIAVEQAALWEPLLAHVLAFAAAVTFMARRYGRGSAAATALIFALLPSISGQFLPGVLTAHTWSLLVAGYAVVLTLPSASEQTCGLTISVRSAVAASLALWLDPACGFPAVLVIAVAGAVAAFTSSAHLPFIRWSLIGAGLTCTAWLIDGAPWTLTAGELRYVHPLYAVAWLGIGLALDAIQQLRGPNPQRQRAVLQAIGAVALVATLGYVQAKHDFAGWFYPSLWMRRITSLEETSAFATLFDWIGQAPAVEVALLSAPLVGGAAALMVGCLRSGDGQQRGPRALLPSAILFVGLLVLAFFRARWSVIASLAAVPVIAVVARDSHAFRRIAAAAVGVFLLALLAWNLNLPASLKRPAAGLEPSPGDVEALLYRHFSHWIASHEPGQKISALAPPELSDSIVFHGAGHVLMSTAWESYPGQLAARRILSSLESTEADAVIQGHGLTHLILPSWDKVLPLFVQTPTEKGRDTLFDRLKRWTYPSYLRPIPYRLPATPVYDGQTLAVFKVTPPQDEPLMLSRLAEYFVEMQRAEPAAMVARVLAQAYPDDPNAAIGRATVYAEAKQSTEFERELARLAADAKAGRAPFSWDRRVQRAIVLALGRQRELARTEVEACLNTAAPADLLELTPLQAYRLRTLARIHGLAFPDSQLATLAAALGAEYQPEPPAKG